MPVFSTFDHSLTPFGGTLAFLAKVGPVRAFPRLRSRLRSMVLVALWLAGPGATWAGEEPGPPVPMTFGEKLDLYQMRTYQYLQPRVERLDRWFVRKGTERPLPVPPLELRLGLYGLLDLDAVNRFHSKGTIDLDAKIFLPNADRFLKLKVSTLDPTLTPGTPPITGRRSARIGVERSWTDEFHSTLGLRTSLHPQLFTHIDWSPTWTAGHWKFYPFERMYWESKDGVGEITSVMGDRWQGFWNLRPAASFKWSEKKREVDWATQNGGRGWEWEVSLSLGYITELLRESDIVRRINGGDMARGTSVRFGVYGTPGQENMYLLTFFFKRELRNRWIYYLVAPEIEWNRAHRWVREYRLNVGIEMLLWHDRLAASPVASSVP